MQGAATIKDNFGALEIPGFTASPEDFKASVERFLFTLSLGDVKRESRPALWCVLVGGTGTGKSTLFNCLCGFPASVTGVERPKTRGIILAAHYEKINALVRKFAEWGIPTGYGNKGPISGSADSISVIAHKNSFFADWIFVDTPDLDSLEHRNRRLAEWTVALADLVLFVVSQEKYADLQLVESLDRFLAESVDLKVVINKVTCSDTIKEDVLLLLGTREKERNLGADDVMAIPYEPSVLSGSLSDAVCAPLRDRLLAEYPDSQRAKVIGESDRSLGDRLSRFCNEISSVLLRENKEIDELIEQVRLHARETYEHLIHSHNREVLDSVKAALQNEIRRFYSRYDFLAGPRRIVRKVLSAPLKLLGIFGVSKKTPSRHIVAAIRENLDYSSIMAALDEYVTKWFRLISRYEGRPVLDGLKDRELLIPENEVVNFLTRRSEELFLWLEKQFEELSKGIPKTREWGIYSTVVLWAVFMLSVEAALGGGISLFEAAVDSVLAPFVSKGAVEWFARKDIQRIGKELMEKYRRAMEEVINMQRDRFVSALMRLRIPDERLGEVVSFCKAFSKGDQL